MHFFKSIVLSNIIYKPTYIIDSISDLAVVIDETNVKVLAKGPEAILTWSFMKSSNETNFHKVYNLMIDHRASPIYEIAPGKVVFITYSRTLDGLVKVNSHLNLHVSEKRYFGSSFALIYNKNIDPSIKVSIDSLINILYESGLQNFWYSKTLNNTTENIIDNIDKSDAIYFKNVTGVFQVIIVLQSLALILIFVEIFIPFMEKCIHERFL